MKVVAVGSLIALGTAALPATSYAGDREWATVGKVLTGVAAVGVLSSIIHEAGHPGVYVSVDRCAPPPPPRWNYECRPERVYIPGYWSVVVEPAQYGWVRHGCRTEYVVVRPSYTRRVWVPERYEVRESRDWGRGRDRGDGNRYASRR